MMTWSDVSIKKNLPPNTRDHKDSGKPFPTVMVLAGEPSGDVHAGDVIREMKALCPQLNVIGLGGPEMKKAGAKLFFPIDRLSVMGFVEVLCQFKQIQQAFRSFRQALVRYQPDLLVLVDYPGFNLRAAAHAKKYHRLPVLYYIAPKVWAWNKRRLFSMKKFVDHVALIFPFEVPLYNGHGPIWSVHDQTWPTTNNESNVVFYKSFHIKKARIPATYVGNPLMDHLPAVPVRPEESSRLTVGLLPGSRPGEVSRLLDTMLQAACLIRDKHPDCRFLISCADSISQQLMEEILSPYRNRIEYQMVYGRPVAIFEQSHLVIAASGTVTLEAALRQVPCVLVYKVSSLSYHIARRLVTVPYAGLANLIAGEPVMPELLQDQANARSIARTADEILMNLDGWTKKLTRIRTLLGDPGAAKRTAVLGLNMIKKLAGKFDK